MYTFFLRIKKNVKRVLNKMTHLYLYRKKCINKRDIIKMESLFIRKIYLICEKLLFGNEKITLPVFLKKCKKQDIKIIRAVAERLVAFLQSLPKNLALFQALESTFEYILQEQTKLSKREQEYIFRAEKLEFKKHIMEYETTGAIYLSHKSYKNLFTKSFIDMFKVNNFSRLSWFLGELWIWYGDKKNLKYDIKCDVYIEDLGVSAINTSISSPKTFKTFRGMALQLLSHEKIDKVYISKIYSSSVITFE